MVHGIRELHARRGKGLGMWLRPWSRMTGWRAVHAVMQAAGLEGVPASPKGLRHGFGVAAVTAGIPLNLVQKWLGHGQNSARTVLGLSVSRGGRRYDVQAAKRQTNERRKTQEDRLASWESWRVRSPDSAGLGFYGEPSRAAKVWTLWGA